MDFAFARTMPISGANFWGRQTILPRFKKPCQCHFMPNCNYFETHQFDAPPPPPPQNSAFGGTLRPILGRWRAGAPFWCVSFLETPKNAP